MVGHARVAAKAVLVNLVRQSAIDLAKHNVLVKGIAPGRFASASLAGECTNPRPIGSSLDVFR